MERHWLTEFYVSRLSKACEALCHHNWRAGEAGQQYSKSFTVITMYLHFYHQCRGYCRDVMRNAKLAREHHRYFGTNHHFQNRVLNFALSKPENGKKPSNTKKITHLKNPTKTLD